MKSRAIAVARGLDASSTAEVFYSLDFSPGPLRFVTFAPETGVFDGGVDVALSVDALTPLFCVTLDGSSPSCEGSPLSEVVCDTDASAYRCTDGKAVADGGASFHVVPPVDGGAVTVRPSACARGALASPVSSAAYTFTVTSP